MVAEAIQQIIPDISAPLKALQNKFSPLHHVAQDDQFSDSGSESHDLSSTNSSFSSDSPTSSHEDEYHTPPVNTLTAQREAFFSLDPPSATDEIKNLTRPFWPRNPQGAPISPIFRELKGKKAPNGIPVWGATPEDIYKVYHDPARSAEITYASGSSLMGWAKRHGELEWAKEEILRAEQEEEPKQVFPFDRNWGAVENVASCATSDAKIPAASPCPTSSKIPLLQIRLPLHLLPTKLVVNDPGNVLPATNPWRCPDSSNELKRVRTYTLSVCPVTQKRIKEARRQLLTEWTADYVMGTLVRVTFEDDRQLFLPGPSPPRPMQEIAETKIDVIRKEMIGEGGHSYVYNADWELPRHVLSKPKICTDCVIDAISKALQKEKPQGEEDTVMPPKFDIEIVPRDKVIGDLLKTRAVAKIGELIREDIHVEYDSECCHVSKTPVRVRVAAKLGIKGDDHLVHEAHNYQKFPDHFFEHWNGYNMLLPLSDPVPIGAVVPQFYGFYKPAKQDLVKDGYLSPILLMERCGIQACSHSMMRNTAERAAAASLFLRFQCAGWIHNSIGERNVVVDEGRRFRLIDFGRSRKCKVVVGEDNYLNSSDDKTRDEFPHVDCRVGDEAMEHRYRYPDWRAERIYAMNEFSVVKTTD